jgi:Flp pilus assembly pilin Flp
MKLQRLRTFIAESSGAAAVEFALVALPLVLLTIGIVEVGRAIFTQQSLTHAIDHAARSLYINPALTDAALRQIVLDQGFLINAEKLSPFPWRQPVVLPNGSSAFGVVELQVDYNFESIVADWVFEAIPMEFRRTVVLQR